MRERRYFTKGPYKMTFNLPMVEKPSPNQLVHDPSSLCWPPSYWRPRNNTIAMEAGDGRRQQRSVSIMYRRSLQENIAMLLRRYCYVCKDVNEDECHVILKCLYNYMRKKYIKPYFWKKNYIQTRPISMYANSTETSWCLHFQRALSN
jgi:hypothetical protein